MNPRAQNTANTLRGSDGPAWDAIKVEHMLGRVHAARRRRVVIRAGVTTTAVAAALALFLAWPGAQATLAMTKLAPGDAAQLAGRDALHLADGSSAVARTLDSELELVSATETDVVVRLVSGAASFDVTPGRARRFVVDVSPIRVVVLGTRFGVERRATEVEVSVERGRVRVEHLRGARELTRGMTETFDLPPDAPGDAPTVEADGSAEDGQSSDYADPSDALGEDEEAEHLSAESEGADVSEPRPVGWRTHARQHDYARAYDALQRAGVPVRDRVDDLMLAADAARLSGHPSEALSYLRRVSRGHRGDRRAALAAFTEGRILLGPLRSPGQAASAFAMAQRLAGGAGLTQDALAREVEAWRRAGNLPRAQARARVYLQRYPSGRRADAVRRHAGLEATPTE